MNKRAPLRLLLPMGILLIAGPAVGAVGISLVGSWSLTVGASDLTGGAGTDLAGTYQSGTSAVTLDIDGTTGAGDTWRVDVSRSDGVWDADLTVSVKRTGSGTGSGTLSGGTVFQSVGTTDATFFTGSGDRTGVPLQLELGGVSVQVAPDTYSTTIVYTVVDTL